MSATNPGYRVRTRDVRWGAYARPALRVQAIEEPSISESRLYVTKQIIDDFFLPNIGELLTRISPVDLDPWQRACPWACSRRLRESVIRQPRALVPYMWNAERLAEEGQALIVAGEEAGKAEREIRALQNFVGPDPGELDLITLLGQTAALSLFERTSWGQAQRRSIVDQCLQNSEMSYYLAAAITPTVEEWAALAESISHCPRCSYATLRLSHLPHSITLQPAPKLLRAALEKNALFHWAFAMEKRGTNKIKLMEEVLSKAEPEACALSLALAPRHSHVPGWIEALADQPELAYRTRRLLSLAGQLDEETLLAPSLGSIARRDPRWAFHWVRDFGEDNEDALVSLVPHLAWIADLIESGAFSVHHAHAVDERASQTMKMNHWLRSSFLLYAADKSEENEETD